MEATIERATLTAPDISCGHCEATVKQTLTALPGVQEASASADTKQIAVAFNPSQVSLIQIEEALDEAGYPVQK